MTTANFRMRTVTVITAVTALSWALPALAVAPLEGRTITGDRVDAYDASAVMIYDPNADLTWLRDWNVNGDKPWVDQLIWASNVQMGNFAHWSLPTSRNQDGSGPCYGYNCIGSQMGYLWYEVLGNTSGSFTNAGPFQNVQSDVYWSGTEYAPDPGLAWVFLTYYGNQSIYYKNVRLYAVAVRPGDVAAPIPEPQTWAMLMMGLGVVTVALRRRPR
jgi:hypothetical protein